MTSQTKLTTLQIRNQGLQRTITALEEQTLEKDNQIKYLKKEIQKKNK